jgi:hypothetical protein
MALSPDVLGYGIESWKLWSFLLTTFASAVLAGYKVYQWIKGIRTEEFPQIQGSLDKVSNKIEETSSAQLRSTEFQTQSLVRELAELRGLLYGAFHVAPPVMAPARSKAPKKPAKRPAKTALAMAPAKKAPKRPKK